MQFNGQNLLIWVDKNGIEHEVTLDSNNCDSKRPVWQTDSGSINEKELLPIRAIKYGPLLYAEEMGNVKVGPLECNPLESDKIIDIKKLSDKVGKLEDGLNATIIEHASEISRLKDKFNATRTKIEELDEVVLKCPTDNMYYKFIAGRCYYLEKDTMTYEKAKQHCSTKFVRGKLFEPESIAIFNLVVNTFKDLPTWPKWAWIGVNEKNSENNFHYDSTGVKISFNPPWKSGYGNKNSNSCIMIWTNLKWYDWPCSKTQTFLCEQ